VKFSRILYAPNIHQGGGKALLLPLLDELKHDEEMLFVLDERMKCGNGVVLSGQVIRVKADLLSRVALEWKLQALIKEEATILCMGSLPPLWAHDGKQIVFVQNRYLIDDQASHKDFPITVRFRLMVERWWLLSRTRYISRFIVQTSTMCRLLKDRLDRNSEALPFMVSKTAVTFPNDDKRLFDFIYVASGEPHKNHRNLIEAWVELAKKNHYPSLRLTLNKEGFPHLCSWMASKIDTYNLNIKLLGELPQTEIQELYQKSRAAIYPSIFESFGLPLLEAVEAGLPVLAAESDYVWDVVKPTMTFDPKSSVSIAEAVMNFSFEPAHLAIELLDAKGFLSAVFSEKQEE